MIPNHDIWYAYRGFRRTSRPFKPEECSTKQEVDLYHMAKIKTFTIKRSMEVPVV